MKKMFNSLMALFIFIFGYSLGYFFSNVKHENIEKFSAISEKNFSIKNSKDPDCLGEMRVTEYLFKHCRLKFSYDFLMGNDYLNYKSGIYINELNFAAEYRKNNPINDRYFERCKGVSLAYRNFINKCWENINNELKLN